ncbi:MAG TPA: hypothetical protein VFV48_05930 [Pseudomonadales bacterium]|nr:hypothetical protein [Pseudomonadales bacterium]
MIRKTETALGVPHVIVIMISPARAVIKSVVGNGGLLNFLDSNAGVISLFASITGAFPVTTGLLPFLTPPFFLAFTIAAALFTVGVISFLDSLSEGPCDAEAISICITMGFVAVFLGAWAGSLQAVALFI